MLTASKKSPPSGHPFDLEALTITALKGFFRVAPFEYLGRDRNIAGRQMGVEAGHPLQDARGHVLVMIQGGMAGAYRTFRDGESARRAGEIWLRGRGGRAEIFHGQAVGAFRGRVLYRLVERLKLKRLEKVMDEWDEEIEVQLAKQVTGNPLNPKTFDRMVASLERRLAKIERPAMATALRQFEREIRSKGTASEVERVLNKALSNIQKIPDKIIDPQSVILRRDGRRLSVSTRRGVESEFKLGVKTGFSVFDKRIGDHLVGSHANFVRDEFGERSDLLEKSSRAIIDRGQAAGLGVKEIQDQLVQEVGVRNVLRSKAYWQTVSSAFTNRSRTFTALGTYREAEVDEFEIVAVLDEQTTDVCRFLDGKRFKVDRALANFEEQEGLEDPLDLRKVNPWMRIIQSGDEQILALRPPSGPGGSIKTVPVAPIRETGVGTRTGGKFGRGMSADSLQKNGVHGPPYHGNCRTDLIPVI